MANLLITGSSGFLGKHVTDLFIRQNKDYDRIFTPSHNELDLLKPYAATKFVRAFNINNIIHLAALCGGIGANQKSPGSFIYNNLQIGINILEAAVANSINKVVLMGTVCMYPKFTPSPFKEIDIWNGYPEETNAPYGIAKKTIMEMGMAYHRQYGLNVMTLVPTNLVGEYDHFEESRSHVIPALIKKIGQAIKNNDPTVTVWGDGSASREFLYAGDCARAIYIAAKTDQTFIDPINIGNGQEVTIKNLVAIICKLMKYRGEIVWDSSKPNGQPTRCLNVDRALKILNFKARTTLTEALERTIQYAKDNQYV